VKARLSVEPGVALGWAKWVGDSGDSIAIEHFGASAPGATVLEKFGYNVENVVARAAALLARSRRLDGGSQGTEGRRLDGGSEGAKGPASPVPERR
jgi:transketolase